MWRTGRPETAITLKTNDHSPLASFDLNHELVAYGQLRAKISSTSDNSTLTTAMGKNMSDDVTNTRTA